MNISIILDQLASKIRNDQGVSIDVTNIATLNDGDDFVESAFPTVLSIVNIEEDRTLRNQSVNIGLNHGVFERYVQPTKSLIFSILFTSYEKSQGRYLDGIDKLNKVYYFFQKNTSLYFRESPNDVLSYKDFLGLAPEDQAEYSRITFETVSLSMEQLNQMWSYLGSRYMPSILLKMRIVEIQNDQDKGADFIRSVKIKVWENNENDPTGLLETVNYTAP
jgi:hypothetical protein